MKKQIFLSISMMVTLVLVSVIVIAAAPTMKSVRIDPTTAYYNMTLQGYCNGTDTDGSFTSYNYIWYKNKVNTISGTYPRGYCYQESATTSNQSGTDGGSACGLIYNGTYATSGSWGSAGNMYDGNYGSSAYVWFTQSTAYLYVNYTKPVNASQADSYWNVKAGYYYTNPTTNYTIPVACFNRSIIQLAVSIYSPDGSGVINGSCYNGTAWYQMFTYSSILGLMYEESMWWHIKPFVNTGEELVNTLSGLSSYDNYTFSCQANDSTSTSAYMNSSMLTISNSAPTMSAVTIYRGNASGALINGTCKGTDGDTNNITYDYAWYLNGAINSTGSSSPVARNTVVQFSTSGGSVGQTWILSCRSNDGNLTSPYTNSSAYKINNITLINRSYYESYLRRSGYATLVAQANSSDPSGTVSFDYIFYVNTNAVSSGSLNNVSILTNHNISSLDLSNYLVGDFVKYGIRVYDAACPECQNYAQYVNSSNTAIANSPPYDPGVAIAPSGNNLSPSDTLRGYCYAYDIEGDSLTYFWNWYRNGTVNSSGSTGPLAQAPRYCVQTPPNSSLTSCGESVILPPVSMYETCTNELVWYGYPVKNTGISSWAGRIYVNYTKPAGAGPTSTWVIKEGLSNGSGATNTSISIPRVCWNQPVIQFYMYTGQDISYGGYMDAYCYDGTQYINLFSNYEYGTASGADTESYIRDGNFSTGRGCYSGGWQATYGGAVLYEQGMNWSFDNGINVNMTNISNYANYTFSCYAYDGTDNSVQINYSVYVNGTYRPQYLNVSLSPSSLYMNDTLKGYCGFSDQDSPLLNLSYAWYRNGAINTTGTNINATQGINYNVNNKTNLSGGDIYFFSCRANDGTTTTDYFNSSNATIKYMPPVMNNVFITPTIAYANDSLIGWCNASNHEYIGYSYAWYLNGIINISIRNESAGYYEQQNGTYSSNVDPSFTDNNWTSGVTGLGDYNETYYMNFTQPTMSGISVLNGSYYKYAFWDPANSRVYTYYYYQQDFPACFAQNPVRFRSTIIRYSGTDLYCYNGTDFMLVENYIYTRTGFVEDSMFWNLTTALHDPGASVASILTSTIRKNQNWTFQCMAYDIPEISSTMNSTLITILNTPPIMSHVTLIKGGLYNQLNGTCRGQDSVDLDNITYNYTWYLNGAVNSTGNSSFIPSNTTYYVNRVDGYPGQNWTLGCGVSDGTNISDFMNSSSYVVFNLAPSVTNVSLVRGVPAISGYCKAFDNESSNVTIYYSLYKNALLNYSSSASGIQNNVNYNLINYSSVVNGDNLTLSCTAYDDLYNSTTVNSTFNYVNSKPISVAYITPAIGYANTTFTGSCNISDSDNDSSYIDYQWYINGTPASTYPGSRHCYQETAYVANDCGGLSGGAYSGFTVGQLDGDWNTGWAHCLSKTVYYYKPTPLVGASWIFKIATVSDTVTIPYSCINNNATTVSIFINQTCYDDGNDTGYVMSCSNGTGWQTIYSFRSLSNISRMIWEEAITWNINVSGNGTTPLRSPGSYNLSILDTGPSKGSNWTFSCRARDLEIGDYSNSTGITIYNSEPVMISSQITPSTVYPLTNMTGWCKANDNDVSDLLVYNYTWYLNGTVNETGALGSFSPGVLSSISTKVAQAVWENWTFSCLASDGTNISTYLNSSPTVIISPNAQVREVYIMPSTAYIGNTIKGYCNITSTSPNILYNYTWYLNGIINTSGGWNYSVIQGIVRNLNNITSGVVRGQNWIFGCFGSDGYVTSDYVNSSVLTISNSISPPLNASITPQYPGDNNSLSCIIDKGTDADGDNLTSVIKWYINGTYNSAYDNLTMINAANTSIRQTWKCGAQNYDGYDLSTQVNSSSVLINNPPNTPTATINPSIVKENDKIIGVCNGSDPDGILSRWYYSWYKNGALNETSYTEEYDAFYQETADVISWRNDSGYLYLNYTKKNGADGAIWQVAHGPTVVPIYNVTVPLACFNAYNDTLALRFVSIENFGGNGSNSYSHGDCYNGTGWLNITNTTYGQASSIGVYNRLYRAYDGSWSRAVEQGSMWMSTAPLYVGWGVVYEDPTNEGAVIYEEALYWTRNNTHTTMSFVKDVPLTVGDNWTFTCKVSDNFLNSSEIASTPVKIQPSSLEIKGGYVLPVNPTSNQTLKFYCNSTNNITENVTYGYNITRNGAVVFQSPWCYQETANVSTICGGKNTGSYWYNDTDPGYYVYVNYTKPTGASFNSQWIVMHGHDDPYSVTIPSGCWNYDANKIILRMYSYSIMDESNPGIDAQHGNSYGECYDGSWELITRNLTGGYDNPGSGNDFPIASTAARVFDGNWSTFAIRRNSTSNNGTNWYYSNLMYLYPAVTNGMEGLGYGGRWWEEAINWYITPATFNNYTGNNVFNISGEFVNLGDNYSITCRATTPTQQTRYFSSGTTTVNASYPIIANVTITPSPANATDTLTCNYYYVPDMDPGQSTNLTITWNVAGTNSTYHNNTLGPGNYSDGENVYCTVYAVSTDGFSTNTSQVLTIADFQPPQLYNFSLSNTNPLISDAVTITAHCNDSSGYLSSGYPKVSFIDPNGLTVGNLSMFNTNGSTWIRNYIFSTVGTYRNFSFYCQDASGNQAYNFTSMILTAKTGGTPPGGGGGTITETRVVTANLTAFCGDAVCGEGESPFNCARDCKVDVESAITCLWKDPKSCIYSESWFATALIVFVVGAFVFVVYRAATGSAKIKKR
jgi:hypothetical protein